MKTIVNIPNIFRDKNNEYSGVYFVYKGYTKYWPEDRLVFLGNKATFGTQDCVVAVEVYGLNILERELNLFVVPVYYTQYTTTDGLQQVLGKWKDSPSGLVCVLIAHTDKRDFDKEDLLCSLFIENFKQYFVRSDLC